MMILAFTLFVLAFLWSPTCRDYLYLAQAAYNRGEYEKALEHYQAAAKLTHDPGQVAFNQAAVLVRLKRWHNAILSYTQALEDAQGRRRILSLYGRGTVYLILAMDATGTNKADLLGFALNDLSQCLAEAPDFEDARYHLTIAQRLLRQMEADLHRTKPLPKTSEPSNKPITPDSANTAPTKPDTFRPGLKPVRPFSRPTSEQAMETHNYVKPGRGHLPAIPAQAELTSLSAEQAQAWLDVEWQRISQARAQRAGLSLSRMTVRDW
ncbi:MAG: tetratricopeptide repeat protein [Gemmatales bacterium]|nr:tetratricopeptide repeat protein [Gemmatales bacterium]MDW7995500.1 tetratricopeptide repeat protein [Gemmatales bacterium]